MLVLLASTVTLHRLPCGWLVRFAWCGLWFAVCRGSLECQGQWWVGRLHMLLQLGPGIELTIVDHFQLSALLWLFALCRGVCEVFARSFWSSVKNSRKAKVLPEHRYSLARSGVASHTGRARLLVSYCLAIKMIWYLWCYYSDYSHWPVKWK